MAASGEFPPISLGDVTIFVNGDRGHNYPAPTEFVADGIPFISAVDLVDGRVVHSAANRISEQAYASLGSGKVQPGDVLFCLRGSLGKMARVTDLSRGAIASSLVIVRPTSRIDGRYLYYALVSLLGQGLARELDNGSVQPNISARALKAVLIPLPTIAEQRAIAHILGTLDDKIELNRQMNETLEAMARALFKSWFVDFDPVRAKAEGRDTGLPPHIADLFPGSFEDSELGEIPRGWEVSTIGDLCDLLTSGGTPARMTPSFWDGGSIPWFKTGELGDGPLLDSEEHITEAALANSSCKLWPAGTVLFALYASPTVGRLGVLTRAGTSNQAAAGLVAKASYGVPFLRRLLIAIRMELQSIAVGAAQQNINQAVLRSHRVVVPGSRLAGTYSRMMSPLDARQSAHAWESQTLSALRDALLPGLVSGEVRVHAQRPHCGGAP